MGKQQQTSPIYRLDRPSCYSYDTFKKMDSKTVVTKNAQTYKNQSDTKNDLLIVLNSVFFYI